MYKFTRYAVFGLFVLCNVIIPTSAVWNLSALRNGDWSAPRASDGYSTFIGCVGLMLIFPILFCELATKEIFLTKVWFELAWLGTFSVLHLAGAVFATAVGHDQLCQPLNGFVRVEGARCTSSRLLQAFSWICAISLLLYFLMLIIFTFLAVKDDSTIWQCHVRRFPWYSEALELSSPESPGGAQVPRRVSRVSLFGKSSLPSLAAPKPRRATNSQVLRGAVFSFRSEQSQEYDFERYQPDAQPIEPPPAVRIMEEREEAPAPSIPHQRFSSGPSSSLSFYPQHMQVALGSSVPSSSPVPSPTREPTSPGPNPLGSWPQLNPPLRRPGERRKTQHSMRSPSQEEPWSLPSPQGGLPSHPTPAVRRPSHYRRVSGHTNIGAVAGRQVPGLVPTHGGDWGEGAAVASAGRTLL